MRTGRFDHLFRSGGAARTRTALAVRAGTFLVAAALFITAAFFVATALLVTAAFLITTAFFVAATLLITTAFLVAATLLIATALFVPATFLVAAVLGGSHTIGLGGGGTCGGSTGGGFVISVGHPITDLKLDSLEKLSGGGGRGHRKTRSRGNQAGQGGA